MRHVGRFDDETGLPITEVTQAEFDDLDITIPRSPILGSFWKDCRHGQWRLGYCCEPLKAHYRHLVIVEHAEPARQSDPRRFRPRGESSLWGDSSAT